MAFAVYFALVVVVWIGLTVMSAGSGLLVRRCCGLRARTVEHLLLAPWVGWGGAICFLQLWNLLFPADWRALAILAATGIAGLTWTRSDLIALLRQCRRGAFALGLLLFLLSALWLANQSVTQPEAYDTGLYHLNAIRWAASYPVVPGIANLHVRIGFNSSSFLYAAILDHGFFRDKVHHLASGLLLLWIVARGFFGVLRTFGPGRRPNHGRVFDALCLAPVVVWTMRSGYVTSPSPDVPVFLLGLVVASLLLDILPARTGETPPDPAGTSAAGEDAMRELRHTALTVAFLSGIGITVRIGFAVFGAAVSLLALCAAVRGPQNLVSRAGVFGWAALAVAASMVPWMARGVVMSGYPVFPCSVGGMPVDWRLPAGTVHEIAAGMKSWSRVPGDWTGSLRPGWRWVWPWVSRLCRTFPFELRVPLSLAALSSALLVLGRRQRPSPTIWQWLLLLAPLASVAFWFCTAPEPRVAGSAFWVLGLTPLTLYLLSCNASVVRSVVLIFSVVLMAQNVNPIAFLHCWQRDPDPAKSVPLQTRTTNSGLTVHVPVEGDQCWSAPLPCAPRFDPNLRLRTRGDMSKGFTVGGAAGAGR